MTRMRRARLAGWLCGLGLLFAAGVLHPPAAAAAAVAGSGSPSLVFSEVYAPVDGDPQAQWFEIHNVQPKNSLISYPLNGLILATGGNQVTLKTREVIPAGGYTLFVIDADAVGKGLVTPVRGAHVVPVPDLGVLDPQKDALILYTPDKALVIDELNWGPVDTSWVNYNPGLWPRGLDPLTNRNHSWGRTPPDQDSNLPRPPSGDWTVHELPTPGGGLINPPASDFLLKWTNWAGGASSLLLWLAFIIIAIIAYRFERLRDTRTYWQLLLLAPSGILFYTAIVIIGFSQPGAALSNEQKWAAFPVLAISALFCLIAVGIFRNVARSLLEGD